MPPPSASRNFFSAARSFEAMDENIRFIACTSCTSPGTSSRSFESPRSVEVAISAVMSKPWLMIDSGYIDKVSSSMLCT